MRMEALLEYLETYREPITNWLDLLSFILVTPPVLEAIIPAAQRHSVGLRAAFAISLSALILLGFQLYLEPIHPHDPRSGRAALTFFIVTGVVLLFVQVLGLHTLRFIGRHAITIGVVLFLVSRIFAFITSMYAVQFGGA